MSREIPIGHTVWDWEATPRWRRLFGARPFRRMVTTNYYGHLWVEHEYSETGED